MEAPTPVSALLHAGVVNLGGFLLIRLGLLVADVPAAQALLVVVGSISAVLAALVMTTRISIKVALAWSTCAQMGFMMMECGLGLHDLALLHLVAHSLYKAHAFLGAGGAVEQNRLQQMTPPAAPLRLGTWMLGAVLGLVLVVSAAWLVGSASLLVGSASLLVGSAALLWGTRPAQDPALWVMAGILALALAPLLAGQVLRGSGVWRWGGLLVAFAVSLAYFGLHLVASRWLGPPAVSASQSPALVAWVLACFGLLFVVQTAVRAFPHGALARRLYPWLFAGLYLDELFTRLTFRVWPARRPTASANPASSPATIAGRPTGAL
jgi:NAD(P)H-quinone oxidoreductase subunit 5